MALKWFLAVMVRGSFVDGQLDDERMGDLLYRLVSGEDAESAYTRAMELGADVTDTYPDEKGKNVSLEFLGLADLTEIGDLTLQDGAEVYSQLLTKRPSDKIAKKVELTVFEPELDADDEELEEDARFSRQ